MIKVKLVIYTVLITHFLRKVYTLLLGKKARLRESFMVGLFAIYERNDRTDYVLLDDSMDYDLFVFTTPSDLYDFLLVAPPCKNGALFSRLHCAQLNLFPENYCKMRSMEGREFIDETSTRVVDRLIADIKRHIGQGR